MDQLGLYGQPNNFWRSTGRPLPALVIFTDRDDGKEWFLTHTADGSHISLTSGLTVPRSGPIYRAGIDGGPYLFQDPDVYLKLFVRGGHLGYETMSPGGSSGPVLTRRGMARQVKRVYMSFDWHNTGNLAWQDGV